MPETNLPTSERIASPAATTAVLELTVRNHPGTMSHITGLFARRGFNLEAIACAPLADRATSRILLLVSEEPRLVQVERQLEKLHDVLSLRHRLDLAPSFFSQVVADAQTPAAGPAQSQIIHPKS